MGRARFRSRSCERALTGGGSRRVLVHLVRSRERAPRQGLRIAIGTGSCETEPVTNKADLHRLIYRLPDGAVDGAAILLQEIADGRIDPEQGWFWTREWQAKEREADDDLAAGRGTTFASDNELLAALEERTKPLDPDLPSVE